MVYPSFKFVFLFLSPAPFLVLFPVDGAFVATLVFDLVLCLIWAFDAIHSVRADRLEIDRICPKQISLGGSNPVGWSVRNRSGRRVAFELTDDVPPEWKKDRASIGGTILGNSFAEIQYRIRPTVRGLFTMGDIHLRFTTPLGLGQRQVRIPRSDEVKVYPNVANLSRYDLAVQRQKLAQLGMVSTRFLGKGSLFESLREYVPGDDLGDVAWKATSRRGKMLVRNYESEKSQNLLVLIDCGRLMTAEIDDLSRLDYAINASLLLTYVAMKQGDRIGMIAFSNEIESYLPPLKGHRALSRMNDALYRLEPRLVESDYERACRFLALQHRKRSLIVLFTDVIDKNASSVLMGYTARFARKHLPVCVAFRNLEVEGIAQSPVESASACFSRAVALQMLERRKEALAQMRRFGVDVLEADPRTMTPRVIDRYLRLKRSRRLS